MAMDHFLMHMGSAVSIAKYSKNNFKYILLNNKSHESVGAIYKY